MDVARGGVGAPGVCTACGTQNQTESAFCSGCGKSLTKWCQGCGAALKPGARFCQVCGKKVDAIPITAASIATSVTATPATAILAMPVGQVVGPVSRSTSVSKAPAGNKRTANSKRLFIGLALLLAAVLVAGFVIIRYLNSFSVTTTQGRELTTDYNAMVATDNKDIDQANSKDVSTSIAGLKARVAVHKTFDAQVAAIAFPATAAADKQRLLSTDAALEQVMSQMAAARSAETTSGDATKFNALVAQADTLRKAFEAAEATLGQD